MTENALQSGYFWKRCRSVFVWTPENGTFQYGWRHIISPRFRRTIFIPKSKMADIRFTLSSFVLGLISSSIACFQLNLLLLTIHADCLIRRGGIIRQLGLLLSKLRLPFTLERIKISKLRFLAEYKYTLNELLVKKCFPIRLIVCEIWRTRVFTGSKIVWRAVYFWSEFLETCFG